MEQAIQLNVNGSIHHINVESETPLLYVLRNQLGLKSPKYGCGSEQCGACKVLVDGSDVPSCQLSVRQVEGMEILTVEGLGQPGHLHPLQQAFIEEGALQCGYCTPGMIIAAQGLLNRTRYPTDDQIRSALSENICRCGIYDRVRRAIKLRIGRPEQEPGCKLLNAVASQTQRWQPPDKLPASIIANPELDSWIHIERNETVTVYTGKVEIGQGIQTALAQIAAEELDVSLQRIRIMPVDTLKSPNEGITAGSMSLETSGNALRTAAAEARQLLLEMAFEELEAVSPAVNLHVDDGIITDPKSGRQTSYWQLHGGQLFGRRITGAGTPKITGQHRIVGQEVKRLDLPAKVAGQAGFVHDMDLHGMLHGRIVRPPAYSAVLESVDDSTASRMPGVVKILRDGSFLAVIADREEQALAACADLERNAIWAGENDDLAVADIYDYLRCKTTQSFLIQDGTAITGADVPEKIEFEEARHRIEATFCRPYHMHGSLGPSAAVAIMNEGHLTVWSHTQGPFLLRDAIAQVIGIAPEKIRIIHAEGSGSYGHSGADDVALDAALLAQTVPGRAVSVKWTRSDEHTWEPYGPAMMVEMQADLDSNGQIGAWNHDVWSFPHSGRPRAGGSVSGLLASWHLEKPWHAPEPRFFLGSHFGSYRNADPLYSVSNKRIVAHFVPDSPLRTSSLRGLGAYANVFAIESFIDELALAAGQDPVAYRLALLEDERAKAVIEAAAELAGWRPRKEPAGSGLGSGFAFAQYKNRQCFCAVCIELEVDIDDGQIKLTRAFIAADAGQIVNPDGLSSQLEGGLVQSASWTLKEQVKFNQHGILSRDWDSYPVLRSPEAPEIKTVLINRPDLPFLGSGEAAQGPTAAAIANAVFDAAGVRVRDLPITVDKIRRQSTAIPDS